MINKKSTKKIFTTFLASLIILSAILFSLSAVSAYTNPATVNLGTADHFVILAQSGISTTGTTAIVGDIGVSPAAATFITGFGLIMDSSNVFSTSSLITGNVYAADYTEPTPTSMTIAISDMQTAYTDAAGRAPSTNTVDTIELGAGNIGGMTLAPGVYKWSNSVLVSSDLVLDAQGDSNAVWIFQISQNLDVAKGVHISLIGGEQASNIFWQVAGQTTLGTTSVFNGNILDQTAIVLNTGATLNGRALAQTAVTLDANGINTAAPVIIPPVTPPVSPPQNNQGSSGNGGTCAPIWSCSSWSACSNGQQTRTCDNTNTYCSTQVNKPTVSQLCTNANQVTNQNETVTPKTNNSNTIQTTPLTGAAIGTSVGNFFVNTWDAIKGFFVRLFSK